MSTAEEIIVVGGGFAGVSAARDLSHLGYRVRLLEARGRLGGRTHVRRFEGTDVDIELGGAWFMGEDQRFVHREVTRYGLSYKHDAPLETFGHLVGGERIETPFPLKWEDAVDFERFALHTLKAASIIDPAVPANVQPLKAFDTTWEDYIAPLGLSPALRDLIDAWALHTVGGRATEDGSAISVLWMSAMFGHSLVRWHTMVDKKIDGGTRALVDAIIGDSNADVRLDTPVVEVEQDGTRVHVTTAEGEVLTAAGAVIATPVNCWPDITFSPALSDDKIQGAALRPGCSAVKLLALVEDAPAGFMGYGSIDAGHGVTVVFGQGEVDGAQLLTSRARSGGAMALTALGSIRSNRSGSEGGLGLYPGSPCHRDRRRGLARRAVLQGCAWGLSHRPDGVPRRYAQA